MTGFILRARIASWPWWFALVLASSCAERPATDWYDASVQDKEAKKDYIQTQVSIGVDPEQARKQYELNEIILNTEGRNSD